MCISDKYYLYYSNIFAQIFCDIGRTDIINPILQIKKFRLRSDK